MAIVTFLFALFLFYSFQIQGSSAAVTDVFVKTGDDFILNLTEAEIPPNSRFCVWLFKDDILVEFLRGFQPDVINRSGKVEVLEKSYSVKLKDLEKSHSGIYTAKVVSPREQILTQYNVTVQDPVSPVDLNVTYMSCSSSSYSLTATCRADDSSISITLRCEKQTCNQDGGERRLVTKSGSSLHVYRMEESIVCSHSNQVSRNESIRQIENHCTNYGNNGSFDNTIYALPEEPSQHNPYENPAEITETPSPTSTYALVQFHNPTVQPSVTSTSTKPQPETIYAQVDRAAKSNPKPAAAKR
ncbi:uncharacterized protein LOC129377940 [Poeciliopsis prolifica]|uniref:uncharacterized protein LOC129377940 n=1 Tax=Poeciliopsis prolifica TaxID=188132 RepID=UPI0024141F94|nr:uncharacterized protein LOC129377940 [Poeciliopsis prolifica]